MLRGDFDAWRAKSRRIADRLTPHIVAALPQCAQSFGVQLTEDAISRNLVVALSDRRDVRRFFRLIYHFEPLRQDSHGNWQSTGEIDIVAFPSARSMQDFYLSFECKRVNVSTKSGFRSRAPEYVVDGVCRFVKEQYAEGVPFACMLAYVVDGDTASANTSIRNEIVSRSQQVLLDSQPVSRTNLGSCIRFETVHQRILSRTEITILHILVSCV